MAILATVWPETMIFRHKNGLNGHLVEHWNTSHVTYQTLSFGVPEIDIHLAIGYEISQVAIFKPKSGKNGHQSSPNFEIDIYRPCDISISKVWRPWLIYTKLIIFKPLSWPIWPYLDQNGHLRVYKQCDISN